MPEERRVVTVLFADVANSTALGEANDPEDVRALLGRYYAIAKDVVAEHGGTLEKFIGDSVMAVFGIPQAHGDDAERALSAALALRRAVAEQAETATLTLRMGVNTGEVVATRERAGDFLVTGDAVNVAARLQQSADPGTILVGERTRLASGTAFRFGVERLLEVKGKRDPLRASTLEERLARRVVRRAPLVGREADLAQLELVARRAFSERRPQLVTITAPAGTGKSRLVEEFAARLPDAAVATAQCLPYGAAVTYLPLRGIVGALLDADDDALLGRIEETLRRAGHSDADALRLAGIIGATIGRKAEVEEREREEFFGAWRVLIESLASERPLVVVFEDLHWASDSLLDLVDHVTHPRTAAPLLMLALARPELLDRRPAWGGGRRNFAALGLEPLSGEETRRLVELLTVEVPADVRERIVERAGGNPFFAGELVRAFEERGADAELPDTVHATVLARLDALPESERATLQYASVVGRTVRPATVRLVLADGIDVEDALESLADRDMLVRSAPGVFTFRHIVIREVAYSTLPRAERIRAHVAVARALEERDELPELVAYHYRQALSLVPPGRPLPESIDAGRAVRALERAASFARNAGAFAEARQLVSEALRVAPDQDRLRLRELLGDSGVGDLAVAAYRDAYEEWRALPASSRDEAQGARLLRKRLTVYGRWQGSVSKLPSHAEFSTLVDEARALLEKHPDPAESARVGLAESFYKARYLESHGYAEQYREAAQRAVAFFHERRDANAESEALDALNMVHRMLSEWDAGIATARRRLALGSQLSLLERQDAYSVMCWDLTLAGRFGEVLAVAEEGLRTLRPGEPEAIFNHAASWAAYASQLSGDWDATLLWADRLRTWWEETGRSAGFGRQTLIGWVAGMHVAAARMDGTRLSSYRTAYVAIAALPDLPPDHSLALAVRAHLERDVEAARLAIGRGREREVNYPAELLALFALEHGIGFPPEVTSRAHRRAEPPPLLAARITLSQAIERGPDELRAAIAELERAGLYADAARALAILALRTGDEAVAGEARRRLTALGDRLFLQRLEEGAGAQVR